ncbi:hypothetical protein PHISCL_05793 [Aspergillus sclerotialis]|uniref:Uncharacterized protein n=1 Tax=Aspergillus sclerotialis TaxID=2070753 RepID=A0A3A2ZV45_9EURO|nr:hypothetical protein PHISCL_05793 [Aspergillus sclerotialis]
MWLRTTRCLQYSGTCYGAVPHTCAEYIRLFISNSSPSISSSPDSSPFSLPLEAFWNWSAYRDGFRTFTPHGIRLADRPLSPSILEP